MSFPFQMTIINYRFYKSLESSRLFVMSLKELDNCNMNEKTQITPYPLRIPPEMREQLEAAAKAGDRSLHAEIMRRLENSFDDKTSSNIDDYINLVTVFNRLMDEPELFEVLKKRREMVQKLQPLQDLIRENEALFDEELENAPDNTSFQDIVERVKKRLGKNIK